MSVPVVEQPRFGIHILPRHAQVDDRGLCIPIRVLIRRGVTEGFAFPAPDDRALCIGRKSWGIQVIGVDRAQDFLCRPAAGDRKSVV